MDGGEQAASYLTVLVLIAATQLLSSLRFLVLCRAFAGEVSFRRLHRTNLASIGAGMLFFNFFGQAAARAISLSDRRASARVMVLVTALERGFTIVLLAGFGLWALLATYGAEMLPDAVGATIGIVALSAVAAVTAAVRWAVGPTARRALRRVATPSFAVALLGGFALSLAMLAMMAASYVVLAQSVADAPLGPSLALAVAATMLGASFPIAPGGWGAREAASVFAFSQTGVAMADALHIGLAVGVLSVVALGVNVAVERTLGRVAKLPPVRASTADLTATSVRLRSLLWFGAMLVGCVAAVQAPIPIGGAEVTLNVADPLALVVALSAALVIGRRWIATETWSAPMFAPAMAALALGLALAWAHGVAQFGATEWATVNRLVGFGVVLAFFASGALLAGVWGRTGVRRAAKALCAAVIVIFAVETVVRLGGYARAFESLNWVDPYFVGFLANRNAWSIFIAVALALYLAVCGDRRTALVPAVLFAAMFFTASRSGFVAAALMFAFAWASGRLDPLRTLGAAAAIAAGVLLTPHVLALLGELAVVLRIDGFWADGRGAGVERFLDSIRAPDHVQADRLESLYGGWTLFVEHPIFGAGLGAFMNERLSSGLPPLVIHNTPLWLLAEFGVLGALAFAAPFVAVAVRWFGDPAWRRSDAGVGLALLALGLGVFALFHDVAYQRVMWFALGLLIVRPGALRGVLRRSAATATPEARPAATRSDTEPHGVTRPAPQPAAAIAVVAAAE